MRKPTSLKTILNNKPATVKKAKKKAAKKAPPANMAMPMMDSPKRVTVEKAGNGYIVSDHMAGKSMVSRSHTGMTKHLKGMMED